MKFKKSIGAALCASMLVSTAAPVMAAPVLATFIVNGNISSQTVEAGQSVTAPAVPVLPGFTFCGFDHSLANITTNTTYTAVYVSNTLGETAIAAKKASLPAPAVTATTVANPVANPAAASVNVTDAMKAALAALQTPAAQTAVTNVVNATVSAAQTPAAAAAVNSAAAAASAIANNDANAKAAAQQAALAALAALQTQQAKDAAKTAADAAKTVATDANVQQAASAAAAAVTPVIAPVVSALPSWATLSEGVSASGAAELYKHLKNVKGLDDATIQGNWGALMHHYSLYGVKGL